MAFSGICLLLIALSGAMYYLSASKIRRQVIGRQQQARSLLRHYGQYAAIWTFVPAFFLLLMYTLFSALFLEQYFLGLVAQAYPDVDTVQQQLLFAQMRNVSSGFMNTEDTVLQSLANDFRDVEQQVTYARGWLIVLFALALAGWAYMRNRARFHAREAVEIILRRGFLLAACIAVFTTVAIVFSLLIEAVRFFQAYPLVDFLTGLHWSPNTAIREDQVGSSGSFGMVPVLVGTLFIALIAMLVALPIGLFSAIYMSEFAHPKWRNFCKPALEVLAGIPTVVYGFFAALTAAPFFRRVGTSLGLDVSSESALAAGVVMGVMIIPFISSLSDDVMRAVPGSLRDAALGLGATRAEMVTKVLLPAAFPGLVGAFLLAISRAIGETMIVVMAVGTAANLTFNPLESVTTVTVQIVGLLTGDTVFDSPKTLSAFALGITLFVMTLGLNVAALILSRRIAEKYE